MGVTLKLAAKEPKVGRRPAAPRKEKEPFLPAEEQGKRQGSIGANRSILETLADNQGHGPEQPPMDKGPGGS